MPRYSEVVKADVRRRMSPLMRQSVAQISAELGIHVVTQGLLEVCPGSPGPPVSGKLSPL